MLLQEVPEVRLFVRLFDRLLLEETHHVLGFGLVPCCLQQYLLHSFLANLMFNVDEYGFRLFLHFHAFPICFHQQLPDKSPLERDMIHELDGFQEVIDGVLSQRQVLGLAPFYQYLNEFGGGEIGDGMGHGLFGFGDDEVLLVDGLDQSHWEYARDEWAQHLHILSRLA